jgi:hypothetical protein
VSEEKKEVSMLRNRDAGAHVKVWSWGLAPAFLRNSFSPDELKKVVEPKFLLLVEDVMFQEHLFDELALVFEAPWIFVRRTVSGEGCAAILGHAR